MRQAGLGMREPRAGLGERRRLVIRHRPERHADGEPVMGKVGMHHAGDVGDLPVVGVGGEIARQTGPKQSPLWVPPPTSSSSGA
jgi:hypothetical protein